MENAISGSTPANVALDLDPGGSVQGDPPPRMPAWMIRDHAFEHPRQSPRYRWLVRALGGFCELAARFLKPPELTPRQNTSRCYEHLFDPLCADTGVWPDYTEGYYPQGDEDYDEAKDLEIDCIVDLCQLRAGLKVIDLGCGNGRILQRIVDEGCDGVGITICRTQQESCRRNGLDVRICSFDEVQQQFPAHTFDVVILSGPTEHFVGEDEARAGRVGEVRDNLFDSVRYLLKPGGRVIITCIHFRKTTDIAEMSHDPFGHEIESYLFFCSLLVRIYSGWYPHGQEYTRTAERFGFKLIFERDGTWDYLLTSLHWGRRLRQFIKRNPVFFLRYLTKLFFQDPRYFYMAFLFWYYGAWTWQFRGRGDDSPMTDKWLLYEWLGDDAPRPGAWPGAAHADPRSTPT